MARPISALSNWFSKTRLVTCKSGAALIIVFSLLAFASTFRPASGANVYLQKGEGGAGQDAWIEMDNSSQLSLAVMNCVKSGRVFNFQLALRVIQERPVAELQKLVGKNDNDKIELFLCINTICEEREWEFLESGFGDMFFTRFSVGRSEPINTIRVIIPNESMRYEYRGDIGGILKKICR